MCRPQPEPFVRRLFLLLYPTGNLKCGVSIPLFHKYPYFGILVMTVGAML